MNGLRTTHRSKWEFLNMMYDFYNEKNDYFSILTASFAFHFILILSMVLVAWLKPPKEPPPPIPFFELINVASPPPAPAPPTPRQEVKLPEPIPEPIPEIKPELKPEVKPEPKPAKPTPTPTPPVEAPKAEPVPEPPTMEMPMDLPKDIKKPDMDMPALRMVGNIAMDPQMQAYLERLTRLIYQNFNPPSGTEIAKGTKTSISFKIVRNGEISEVLLRSPSGNNIWDRLATRAIQITKAPPLPSTYTAEDLPLIFDFREK